MPGAALEFCANVTVAVRETAPPLDGREAGFAARAVMELPVLTCTLVEAVAADTGSVTVIVALPPATPVTTPFTTEATVVLLEIHCRFGGVGIVAVPFDAVTVRVIVWPRKTEGFAGAICSVIGSVVKIVLPETPLGSFADIVTV